MSRPWNGRSSTLNNEMTNGIGKAGAAKPPTCTMCKGALADDAQEGMCGRCHDKREQIRTGNY